MNRILRIGGALIAGILVVVSAYYVSERNKEKPVADISVTTQENVLEKGSFDETDSDGDGIPDWREDYDNTVFETIDTPTPTLRIDPDAEEYVPPTTFTGKFSVAFFQDYVSGGIHGTNFTDPTAFVDSSVNAINTNTGSKRYTRLDFNLVEGNFDSYRNYGNALGFILQLDIVEIVQDAIILQDALTSRNPQKLEELKPIENALGNTVALLLGVEVPAQLSEQHLELLNTYESMRETVAAMQLAFEDPLFTLARMGNYSKDIEHVADTIKIITQKLTAGGVVYSHEEPGAQLYLSDL